MGLSGIFYGDSEAANSLGMSRYHITYWVEKLQNNQFHGNTWGGKRSKQIFEDEELDFVFAGFLLFIKNYPDADLRDVTEFLENTYQRNISKMSTSRLLKSWKWSWKVPSYVQINKFTQENMDYYFHYVNWVVRQNPSKLKFIDESHILPKGLRKSKALAMVNQRVWLKAQDLNQKHCSITLMSSIVHDPPFLFDIREESNTSVDFVSFVVTALSKRFINPGDVLILDNASVHKDSSNVPVLMHLLRYFNIWISYLPTYSPELNPVELIFNKMKKEIRKTHSGQDIELRICQGLSTITQQDVISFYRHCTSREKIIGMLSSIR